MKGLKKSIILVLLCLQAITSVKLNIDEVPSIKDHFASKFRVGVSVMSNELDVAADFIKHHFNAITPENEGKPDAVLDQFGSQTRGGNVNTQVHIGPGLAKIYNFCQQNGIHVRGHTFVWHSQTPDWFFNQNFQNGAPKVSKDIMNQRLENFIKNFFALVKQQFPNLKFYAYDVCNEIFQDGGGGMRWNSNWWNVYHDDSFVINAFTYARRYAPQGCKLFLNDFNEYMGQKTNDILGMANKLKMMGLIDGIGMQTHLSIEFPQPQDVLTAWERFIQTGLEIQVTEMDIKNNNDDAQANYFQRIFQMAWERAAHLPYLTIWGTTDERSWIRGGHAVLFDGNYQPKKSYWAIMQVPLH